MGASNPASAQHPSGKQKDRTDQLENPFHRNPHDPERKQDQPDDRIQDQQNERYGPAKDQQDYPK